MTVQVPLPLVIVKVAPLFEQEPELEYVTALPDAPPVAATVNCALNGALAGACVLTVIAWLALLTVSELEPLLGSYELSPANEAATAPGYVPALMPARLTGEKVATPLAFVVALPALEPFNVKLTVSLGTARPPAVSVAETAVDPPNVPVDGATARFVALVGAASVKQT